MKIQNHTAFVLLTVPFFLSVLIADVIPAFQIIATLRFPLFVVSCFMAIILSKNRLPAKRLALLLGLFSGFGLLSILWSQSPLISLERAILNTAVSVALVSYATAFSSATQLRILRSYAIAFTAVIAVITIYGVLFKQGELYFQGNFRGGLANSNILAQFILVFTIPLALSRLGKGFIAKIAPLSLLLLALLVLWLTRSRASLLAMSVGVGVFVNSQRKFTKRILFILTLVLLAIYFAPDLVGIISSKYTGAGVFGTRMILWTLHLDAILDQPILGYGIGVNPVNFKGIEDFLRDTEKGSSLITLPEELGIPFFLFFLIFAGRRIVQSFKKIVTSVREGSLPQLAVFPAIVVLVSFAHGVFEAWIFNFGNVAAIFFWMCIAFIFRVQAEGRRAQKAQGKGRSANK